MEFPGTPPRRTPRGRTRAKMRAAVLEAAIAELAESGYAALTVDNVAGGPGVHKTTIYRNWKDSDSLVTQALAAHFAADVPPVPPTPGR